MAAWLVNVSNVKATYFKCLLLLRLKFSSKQQCLRRLNPLLPIYVSAKLSTHSSRRKMITLLFLGVDKVSTAAQPLIRKKPSIQA